MQYRRFRLACSLILLALLPFTALAFSDGSIDTNLPPPPAPDGFSYALSAPGAFEVVDVPALYPAAGEFGDLAWQFPATADPQPLFAPANGRHVFVAAGVHSMAVPPGVTQVFQCDGVDDEREINDALAYAQGGIVELSDGDFRCHGRIPVPGDTTLRGQGSLMTTIEVTANAGSGYLPIWTAGERTNIVGFTMRGNAFVMVTRSHVRVNDVRATCIDLDGNWHEASGNGLFFVWAAPPVNVIDDVEFYECHVVWSHTHGFSVNQDYSDGIPRATTNIRFLNCRAVACGYGEAGGSRSEWIHGFDLHEWQDLVNCEVVNCVASDNWEDGFHLEPGVRLGSNGENIGPRTVSKSIHFRNCISSNNGQRNTYAGHLFMSGYYLSRDTHLENCVSLNNRNSGYYVHGGANSSFTACADDGSTYGWKVCKASSDISITDCTSANNLRWALWLSYAERLHVLNFVQTNVLGDHGYQNILGWYNDDPVYQQPVNNSFLDITAHGSEMPIINRDGVGNTYVFNGEWNPPVGPTPTPPGNLTPWPTEPIWPTPTTAWNTTIENITADFGQSRTAAAVGEPVQFTDTSTGNLTIDTWSWNFGDGATSTIENPAHSYCYAGIYTVTLMVSNRSTGASDTVVKEECVQVGPPGPSPVDFEVMPTQGGVALTVVCIDRSASSPTLWRWTVIDGLNGSVTTIGPDNTPVGMNDTYNPTVQTFTFYNPSGVVNNNCLIRLEVWSPYFRSPISATKTVTVGAPLRAEFRTDLTNWTGIAGREGAAVSFQDLSAGLPQAWHWDFGDGNTSSEQNPVHTFMVGPNEVRTFHVSLTATGWGQQSTIAHDVMIYPPVIANINANPEQGSAPLEVHFTEMSTGFPTSWLWDFGDGSSSTARNPVHTYTAPGRYRITLFVERTEPHSVALATSEIVVIVGDEVIADFTGTPRNGDAPLAVQFTHVSINATRWSWTFGDGGTSLLQNPVHTYTVPGNYTVSLRAENVYRMDTETKVEYISVMGPITASFTATPRAVQNGSSVQFTETSIGNPYTFTWDFGDGTTSTERNPTHTYSATGNYTVSLTAANPLHTGTRTEPGYIVVYDEVNASFTANVTGGSAPLHVRFEDTSTGNPTSWLWDFGDGGTSDKQNPIYTYRSPGTYDVTLTASNGFSMGSSTKLHFVITIYGDLTAQFEQNQTAGPNPLTAQFTDTTIGNPTMWAWDFGDGGVSTEKNPVHTFSSVGTYTVTLTVSHSSGSLISAPVPITVYDPITAQFEVNASSGPAPVAVQFTETSTGGADSRRWAFGDGLVSNEANPVHAYAAPGYYSANLTVWNHLRPDLTTTASRTITSYGVPNAAFTASRVTGAAPLTVWFTDTSTGAPTSWNWNFGDGATSTEQNPAHTFVNGAAYMVTLRVANPVGEGVVPATRTITVMGDSGGDTTPPASITNLTASSRNATAITWTWTDPTDADFARVRVYQNGVEMSEVEKGVQTYTLTGLAPKTAYTLNTRTYDFAGNANPTFVGSTATTTAQPGAPVVNFTVNETSGYAPLTVQFTDASTGGQTSWSWTFGDGTTATDQHPAHTYTSAGTYTVALTVANPSGSDSIAKVGYITVTPRPVLTIPGSGGEATDTNGDGKYDDVNGNGRQDFSDIVLYFTQMMWISENEPVSAFDFNGNGRIDFADVVWLFNHLGDPIVTPTPIPRGSISGYVTNVTGGQRVPWTVTDPPVTITIYRKEGLTFIQTHSSRVDADGQYSYTLPADAWGFYKVEEVCPDGYEPVNPPHGSRLVNVTTSSPIQQVDFENRLLPVPLINPVIAINKVTRNGATEGDGLTIDEFTPISWKYTITNVGNVALNNIRVTDDHMDVTPVYMSGDVNNDGYLNLTETWIYSAPGTAIEGYYTNTGTVTGTPPQGGSVTASDASSYTGSTIAPALTTISGITYRVDENGAVIGGEPGITIALELVGPQTLLPILVDEPYLFSTMGMKTTTTGADGSYTFLVPDVPATYRLTETVDPKVWWIQNDAEGAADGIINGFVPGATGQNFYNYRVPADGVVIYLNKIVSEGCPGGYVVDGTTLEGEARSLNYVSFMIGGKQQTYRFGNGEQFRFTIWGDQYEGEVMIDGFEMTALSFNVKFEVRPDRNSSWVTPTNGQFNPTGTEVVGVPAGISIGTINRNLLNEDTTVAYRHPVCSDSQTLLRLNGQVRIDSNPDDTYLEFTNLHEVHDNRYGEGLNTMWISLEPEYDYLLAMGECVYP